MRRTSRSPAPALAVTLALLVVAAVGCGARGGGDATSVRAGTDPVGTEPAGPTTSGPSTSEPTTSEPTTGGPATTSPRRPASPSIGHLPELVDGPAVTVRRCELDPQDGGQALVEAVVVNTGKDPALLQGVPVAIIAEASGATVSPDHAELWNSIVIGPGRRSLLRDEVDLDEPFDGPNGEIRCELGEPDLRSRVPDIAVPIEAEDLELSACSATNIAVRVRNRHDEPVGVTVLVEGFDDAGFSAGAFEFGQTPTIYSDGSDPGPNGEALDPGTVGEYDVDPSGRIADYGTPLEGPVAACEVVAAFVIVDPGLTEVLVD